MSDVHRLYCVKFCLCANPYMPVMFVLLESNGLDKATVTSALAFGTVIMIFGDILTSILCDHIGPRRVVAASSIFQSFAVVALPWCVTTERLYLFEFVIGLTFPAIYGADSKWLKHLSTKVYSERWNQATTWVSQFASALVGGLLIAAPSLACYLSAMIYLIGLGVSLTLPDVSAANITVIHTHPSAMTTNLWKRTSNVLRMAVPLGFCNVSPWLLQFQAHATLIATPSAFIAAQLFGAGLSVTGSLLHRKRTQHTFLTIIVALTALLYIIATIFGWVVLLWLSIGIGLLLRGSLSVATREAMLAGVPASGSIALSTTILNVQSKLVQSVLLLLLGTSFSQNKH